MILIHAWISSRKLSAKYYSLGALIIVTNRFPLCIRIMIRAVKPLTANILIRGLQFRICLGGCFTIQFSDEVGLEYATRFSAT